MGRRRRERFTEQGSRTDKMEICMMGDGRIIGEDMGEEKRTRTGTGLD